MPWFRMYSEARNDRKLASLSDAQFRIWFNLLCLASESKQRGSIAYESNELLALEVACGDVDSLESTLEILRKLRIVDTAPPTEMDGQFLDGMIEFLHWESRQYDKPSDTPEQVAKRVAKHRATQRNTNVTPVKRDVTPSNTTDKKRIDTEENSPPKSPKGDQYSDEFENDFWAHYPKGRGSKQAAFKLWEKLTAEEKAEARDALPKFKAGSDWQRGFHSAPEVWLRGRMWENPPTEEPATARPDGMPPEIARLPWNNAQRVVWEHNHRAQAS